MGLPAHRTLWIALALGFFATAGPPAWAGSNYCRPAVEERLRALGIPEADVRDIQIYAYARGRDDRVVRREANVWLQSCKGNIAMNLSRNCRIREVYTRGQCSLAGAKNY
jgi:hypothetical protein